MSTNRKFQTLFIVAVIAFLATISAVNASAPSKANLAWPPRPVIVPVIDANSLSDYYERHPELKASTVSIPNTTDYFFRHPELRTPVESGDLTDYYFRHPELKFR